MRVEWDRGQSKPGLDTAQPSWLGPRRQKTADTSQKPDFGLTCTDRAPDRGLFSFKPALLLWARVDSNHRPTDYESAALTS
jgi:hypothetical protein